MDCSEAQRFADLSIDGEIEPSDQVGLDSHLAACGPCQSRYQQASHVQSQLRGKLQSSSDGIAPPPGLKVRIAAQLRDEPRRKILPGGIAAVAAGLAGLTALAISQADRGVLDPEETVSRHTRNLPPEVRAKGDEIEVLRFLQNNLKYPVELPRFEGGSSVRLVGARLSNINNKEAAYVMYDQRGARISLFAYPKPRHYEAPEGFEARDVHGRQLMIGTHRGYSVVTWEAGTMIYALVSDVDHAELIELAASPDR